MEKMDLKAANMYVNYVYLSNLQQMYESLKIVCQMCKTFFNL